MRIFIKGDCHGNFDFLPKWCEENSTTTKDVLIILGDAGINYYLGKKDQLLKEKISLCPITLICIHGNHEARPETIKQDKYDLIGLSQFNGNFWIQEKYPNILFAQDGEYEILGKRFLILGGAYSVDKYYRLKMGYNWFFDEQMPLETKNQILKIIEVNNKFDFVLSHTVPIDYEPTYLFLSGIDQSLIDKSMENFLQQVYNSIIFNHWYFAHYHDDNDFKNNISIIYKNIIQII